MPSHDLWVFQQRLDRLEELITSTSERDFLDLAVILRAFLVDANTLSSSANRPYKLRVGYRVATEGLKFAPTKPMQRIEINDCLGGFEGRADSGKPISGDAFLKVPAVSIDGHVATVRDVILAAANIAGGVHLSMNQEAEPSGKLAIALFVDNRGQGLRLLQAIARRVVDAHDQLGKFREGKSEAMSQSNVAAMPDIAHGPGGHAVDFDGISFVEDIVDNPLGDGFDEAVVFALKPQPAEPTCLFEIGRQRPGDFRLGVWHVDGTMELRLSDLAGQQFMTSLPAPKIGQFAILVVRLSSPGGTPASLSLIIDGTAAEVDLSIAQLPTQLQGKSTNGTDLARKSGCPHQMTEAFRFPTLNPDDFETLMANLAEHAVVDGLQPIVPGVKMTKLYNQA